MEIAEIKETIISIEGMTSKRMREYIHYKSIRNFVLHFNDVKNESARQRIIDLLSEYIEEIKESNYDFDVYASTDLARKYLFNIANYYREDANFMRIIKIQHVFMYGVIIDSVLYLGGILSKLWYLPIVTIGFLFYYLFVAILKEPIGRVYGMFY